MCRRSEINLCCTFHQTGSWREAVAHDQIYLTCFDHLVAFLGHQGLFTKPLTKLTAPGNALSGDTRIEALWGRRSTGRTNYSTRVGGTEGRRSGAASFSGENEDALGCSVLVCAQADREPTNEAGIALQPLTDQVNKADLTAAPHALARFVQCPFGRHKCHL